MLSKQFGFGASLQISLIIALICKVIDADFDEVRGSSVVSQHSLSDQRSNHKWNVISCLLKGRLLLMAEISSCSIRLTSSM
jgi:hypothetical protein